jgi:hypothetical protein
VKNRSRKQKQTKNHKQKAKDKSGKQEIETFKKKNKK